MDIELYDFAGNPVGKVEFDPSVLGEKVRIRLLHQAVKMYEANRRVGTAKTKTRSEVAYSKRKPWRQKHTGRARAGARSSPIWAGGGTVFGPKPRDYSFTMPKKSRRLALKSALLSKFQDEEVVSFTGFELSEPRTKAVAGFLGKAGLAGESVLFVVNEHDETALKSVRNIPKVSLMRLSDLNAYEVLRHKRVVFEKGALERLAEEAAR